MTCLLALLPALLGTGLGCALGAAAAGLLAAALGVEADGRRWSNAAAISTRYRLFVDERAPPPYQLLHRGRPVPAPQPRQFESSPMKFRPLHDRVVIRRVEQDAKTC